MALDRKLKRGAGISLAIILGLFLAIGLACLWAWNEKVDNAVTLVNLAPSGVHLNAMISDRKWKMSLAPRERKTIHFVAHHDESLELKVKYADGTTTSMLVNYYFTNGMGVRCTVGVTGKGYVVRGESGYEHREGT